MKFKMVSLAKTIVGHSKDVTACSFSPNSQILASSSGDKTVRLWNIPDGEEVSFSPLLGHLYSVNACCFSPFGTLIATGSTDCNVYLWDAKTGKAIAVLEGHKGGIRVCCFSPNSRYLLSGSGDETFCIWDVTSRKLVRCVEKLESTVMACVFTPDNLHIITGTSVGDLSIWEAQKGKLRRVVEGHDLGVSSCSFSATFGSAVPSVCDTSGVGPHFLLATGGLNDNLVKLWDVHTASAFSEECNIRKRHTLEGHQGQVWDCAFSPNGKILASASGDKNVHLWDPLKGVLLHVITEHSRFVICCAFSPDGKWLATGSNDKTLKLWQVTLTEQGGLASPSDITDVALPDAALAADEVAVKEQAKKLVAWSADDVCLWLTTLGLDQYCEAFKQNAIDGTELSVVTAETLATDLGIAPLGHRNKILRSINEVKKAEQEESIPDEFLCPISREIMTDPVIAADGYSYERSAIEAWLTSGRLTSPMTNGPLKSSALTPNRMLRNIIRRQQQQTATQNATAKA